VRARSRGHTTVLVVGGAIIVIAAFLEVFAALPKQLLTAILSSWRSRL
jgi:hypothetical protein